MREVMIIIYMLARCMCEPFYINADDSAYRLFRYSDRGGALYRLLRNNWRVDSNASLTI